MAFPRIARCLFVVLACTLCTASGAAAAPVLVLREDGTAVEHRHSLAPAVTFPAVRSWTDRRGTRPVRALAAKRRTVVGELKRLRAAGAIDEAAYAERRAAYEDAKRTAKKLSGARKVELRAVVSTLEDVAARGQLTPSRLAPMFLTLERNREWWTTGPLLAPGRRVGFSGSQIVWQYYPRAGIQIQVLGTFGKVNALWSSRQTTALGQAVDELLPLAAERAGGVAWEYYFPYRAGKAPWISSLAQGTALQALARAATRLKREPEVFPVTSRGLAVFERAAPEGVRVPAGAGTHYAQYSFEPGLRILNGFVQSLVGLYDYGRLAADDRAKGLFASGEARAREEVPVYDTGAWSLYSRGSSTHESSLSYHDLLQGFLENLCERTGVDVYCTTAEHFVTYKTVPPELEVKPARLRGGRYGRVPFELSKISTITLQITRGARMVEARPFGAVGYGRRTFGWQVPRRKGNYTVTLTAIDLAGNATSDTTTVRVLKPKRRKRP